MPIHTPESHHWYAKDGEPVYELPYAGKREGTRPATLRDAKKLGLVPGFSTISRVIAAPGLEIWKQRQMLMAALTLPRMDGEDEDAFAKRVVEDSQQHAREARERGTAVHSAVQAYFEGDTVPDEYLPHCIAAADSLSNSFENVRWQCEITFAHPLGYGGKVDIHSSLGYVGDFKTKEFDAESPPQPYPEQAMQLAAYREGLGMVAATCFNLFISVNNPGLVHLYIWNESDIAQEWEVFKHALAIWQARNNHR